MEFFEHYSVSCTPCPMIHECVGVDLGGGGGGGASIYIYIYIYIYRYIHIYVHSSSASETLASTELGVHSSFHLFC